MALTEQSNTTLAEIAEEFRRIESFAICGHVSPDGDCLGSQLALAHALRSLGKEVTCLLARDEPLELGLSLMPGAEGLSPACRFEGSADAFVACDVPNVTRLGDGASVQARCARTFTIDHHACPTSMSTFNYVDPDAPATASIVWELVGLLGIELTPDIARCAFTGLLTDTGGFQFQNADADCFSVAAQMVSSGANPAQIARDTFQNRSLASLRLEQRMLERAHVDEEAGVAVSYLKREDFDELGASKHDAEPLVNVLRSLSCVRVVAMLREQGSEVRGSLRAKDDTDVSQVARSFGGGGHVAAAGFAYDGSLSDAVRDVESALRAALAGQEAHRG